MVKTGALFVITLLIAVTVMPAFCAAQMGDGGTFSLAPLSQDYLDYQKSISSRHPALSASQLEIGNGAGHAMGLIPRRTDMSYLRGIDVSDALLYGASSEDALAMSTGVAYSPSYDLRDQGKLTAIRDQSTSGSCWAFATYASLESYLLPGETTDFSENNLKNTHGFDWDPNDGGGNDYMSTAYLVRWSGPVNEATDPYDPNSTSSPAYQPVEHVQDVLYLPGRTSSTDNDNTKSAIMTYGAVYTSIRYDASYYNSGTYSYYYPGSNPLNHAVAIVGWDDNYDRNNFTTPPAGNGAFIVRNSWNTDWGDVGYFYVSYYDTRIGKDLTVFTAEPADNYDHIYQYDWLGWIDSIGTGTDTGYFAADYQSTGEEILEAAGFYAAAADSEYQIKVYRDGVLVETTSGTIAIPGYHTIRLDHRVQLGASQSFRIEVRLRTPGYYYPVPIEYADSGYSSGAVQNASETFVSTNGATWHDAANLYAISGGGIPDASVCLKAYTTNSGFSFSQTSYPVAESAGSATITVTRDFSSEAASVDYAAAPGNATARDFTPVSDTLNFNIGETSKTFSVPITDDLLLEGNETVLLSLSNPGAGNRISTGNATLVITDDEAEPAYVPALLGFSASGTDGSLSVIDVANDSLLASLDSGEGTYGVAVSPGGAYAYVTDSATGRLHIFSARTPALLQSVTVGTQPRGVSVSPDGSMAAVANSGGNTVSLVNLSTLAVSRTVTVGSSPEAVAFSPDGSTVYAVNRGAGTVSEISAGTGSVTSTMSVGSSPQDVAVAPDGRAYVTNYGGNTVSVINGASATTISLTGHPYGVAVSPDGSHAYVSFPAEDRIDVLSLPEGSVERSIATTAPGSLGLSADGGTLYAAGAGSRAISVFEVPGGSPAGTITAGNNTTGIALAPAYQAPAVQFAGTAYSVNRSATSLTITVERQGCLDRPDAVTVSVLGGNATAGVDYVSPPGTVQFSTGVSTRMINLVIKNSSQGDRTLVLGLSSTGDAMIGANSTAAIAIVEDRMESLTYDLVVGWNLISLPIEPENAEIAELFPEDVRAGIVNIWGWNESTQNWVYYCPDPNDYFYQYYPALTRLETGKAYWIEMNKSAFVTIQGITPAYAPHSQTSLVSGWSFIGITGTSQQTTGSMYQNVVNIWGWDESTQNWVYYCPDPNDYFYQYYPALNTVKPGHGYWVEKY